MTPQEMQALQTFLAQLTQAKADGKDAQAEALIADAVARQPDAAYLLVQRAMLLDHALTNAKSQIATLQAQAQQQGGVRDTFLDPASNWGNHADAARPAATAGYPQQPYPTYPAGYPAGAPGYATQAPAPAQQPQPQPQASGRPGGFLSDGMRGTLGSIATTAAGVAGGAFLFQGIENLFHRNSGGGFFGGQPMMGGMPSETIINNNFYDDGNSLGNNNGGGFTDTSADYDDSLMGGDFFDDDSNVI